MEGANNGHQEEPKWMQYSGTLQSPIHFDQQQTHGFNEYPSLHREPRVPSFPLPLPLPTT